MTEKEAWAVAEAAAVEAAFRVDEYLEGIGVDVTPTAGGVVVDFKDAIFNYLHREGMINERELPNWAEVYRHLLGSP